MNILEKIDKEIKQHMDRGLSAPNLLYLNPSDATEFSEILGAKTAPFPTPVSKFRVMEYMTPYGAIKVHIRPAGPIELRCEIELNGLQLLLRVMEKMKNE